MQGVRTTRGCINCRRRKKGCDLGDPCLRCERLGVPCRYEERRWTFVAQRAENQGNAPLSLLAGPSQRSLCNTDTELQATAEFWSFYLPHEDGALDGSVGGVLSAPWIPTVRALADINDNVRKALQACTFAGLGWMRDDPALLHHAVGLYGQTLQETNRALEDPILATGDNVLACCRLLNLFEMFRRHQDTSALGRSQVTDWGSHVEGTCRLVEMRGREKHLSGHGMHLYDGVRMTATVQGLARRRPNSFTKLAWKLPQRTLRDVLFDLITPIPELLERIDGFTGNLEPSGFSPGGKPQSQEGFDLLDQCLAVCNELHDWETQALGLCQANISSLRLPVSSDSQAIRNDQVSLFDVCQSHGIGFFFICTQYWAVCITTYSSTRRLHRLLNTVTSTRSPTVQKSDLLEWVDPEPHARNIAHTSACFFAPQAGLWAAQSAVFPLGTALSYYARTGRASSAPFKMMLASFADTKSGAIMRDFLQSVVQRM